MRTEVVCGAVIGVSFRVVALLRSFGLIELYCVCLDGACQHFRVDLRWCVSRASDRVQKKNGTACSSAARLEKERRAGGPSS